MSRHRCFLHWRQYEVSARFIATFSLEVGSDSHVTYSCTVQTLLVRLRQDPYYGDCTAYAANVGWCGQYDDDDFSPIRCAMHVASVANKGLPRQHRQWHQWPHLRWHQRQHCNKRVRITQIRIGGSRRPTGRSDADGHLARRASIRDMTSSWH